MSDKYEDTLEAFCETCDEMRILEFTEPGHYACPECSFSADWSNIPGATPEDVYTFLPTDDDD